MNSTTSDVMTHPSNVRAEEAEEGANQGHYALHVCYEQSGLLDSVFKY